MLNFIKLQLSADKIFLKKIKNILGFVPGNAKLYKMAFRHRSMAKVLKNGTKLSNERLEFLGDAVLGAVIAELLFKNYPYKDEGFLTKMRSKIVNRTHLNQLANKMGFGALIHFDKKMVSPQSNHHSMLGDAFEALVGAMYLDKGYDFTRAIILNRIIKPYVDIHTLEITETNFKSKLIEWCQQQGKECSFDLQKNEMGENSKLFTIQTLIDGEPFGIGVDYTKKNAEKIAAEKACDALKI